MSNYQNLPEVILTLDIGGTFIKRGGFTNSGDLIEFPQIPSNSDGSKEEIIQGIQKALEIDYPLRAIGIAIPGPFDYFNGISQMEHKFKAIKNLKLKEFLPSVPVYFVHDANAFLLGELKYGVLRGCQRAGGITLGTGLGAVFADNGVCRNTPLGSPSPEVSLWNTPYKDGIVEDYISTRALLKKAPFVQSVKELADKAIAGSKNALDIWREFGEDLNQVLRPWISKFQMEKVVFGGQICKNMQLFATPLQDLPIVKGELNQGGLWGARAVVESMLN